jgi:uncharacterized membrane protein YhaH (DUF805 family)
MKYFSAAIKKYTDFGGRASVREYWMFVLMNVIFATGFTLLDSLFKTHASNNSPGFFTRLYELVVLLPSLAIAVRRLHDTNKSGGWFFISLIPLVGFFWLIFLLVEEGATAENRFGPLPKKID